MGGRVRRLAGPTAHGSIRLRLGDGVYLGAGIELENSCLLVVVGAREDGRKELLAMQLGYRESANSWAGVLRDLRDRGMAAPLLACGDGALGLVVGTTFVEAQITPAVYRHGLAIALPETVQAEWRARPDSNRRSPA